MKIKCLHQKLEPVAKLLLSQNPKNRNRHSIEQIERLSKIIDFQGQRSPIVISKRSGFIVKGHGRLLAIDRLGWKECAVEYQEYLTEAEEYADLIADNEIARWSELDRHSMMTDLKDLDLGDIDLLGLENFELDINFDPGSIDDQGKLDEKKSVECPECGHEFKP